MSVLALTLLMSGCSSDRQHVATLEESNARLTKTVRALQAQLENAKKRLSAREALKQQIAALNVDLQSTRVKLAKAQSEASKVPQLSERLKAAEHEAEDAQKLVSRLQIEVEALKRSPDIAYRLVIQEAARKDPIAAIDLLRTYKSAYPQSPLIVQADKEIEVRNIIIAEAERAKKQFWVRRVRVVLAWVGSNLLMPACWVGSVAYSLYLLYVLLSRVGWSKRWARLLAATSTLPLFVAYVTAIDQQVIALPSSGGTVMLIVFGFTASLALIEACRFLSGVPMNNGPALCCIILIGYSLACIVLFVRTGSMHAYSVTLGATCAGAIEAAFRGHFLNSEY